MNKTPQELLELAESVLARAESGLSEQRQAAALYAGALLSCARERRAQEAQKAGLQEDVAQMRSQVTELAGLVNAIAELVLGKEEP